MVCYNIITIDVTGHVVFCVLRYTIHVCICTVSFTIPMQLYITLIKSLFMLKYVFKP